MIPQFWVSRKRGSAISNAWHKSVNSQILNLKLGILNIFQTVNLLARSKKSPRYYKPYTLININNMTYQLHFN